MKDKERDALDDLFRSKLHDFEVETTPEDWEAIARRLPGKTPVPFRRTLRYWAAAAVISLLMVAGGVYMYNEEMENAPVAQEIKRQIEEVESRFAAENVEALSQREHATPGRPVVAVASPTLKKAGVTSFKQSRLLPMDLVAQPAVVAQAEEQEAEIAIASSDAVAEEVVEAPQTRSLPTENKAAKSRKTKKKSPRKWGVGMGAGGLTAGTSNSVSGFTLKSGAYQDMQLSSMNAVLFDSQLPKTDISHKIPVSFGLSVSRYLNNRFSLQTGLSYSFLSSEWTTNSRYHGESKQKLHFIGLPLSVTYKIAEWERFQFYAAAGGMTEVNVAGKVRTRLFSDGDLIESQTQRRRMKEWLWSVNTRVGVNYPIIRFVSAFAEVGADYYFDNGSTIETVHSDKPFNVSLQLGFRLGF